VSDQPTRAYAYPLSTFARLPSKCADHLPARDSEVRQWRRRPRCAPLVSQRLSRGRSASSSEPYCPSCGHRTDPRCNCPHCQALAVRRRVENDQRKRDVPGVYLLCPRKWAPGHTAGATSSMGYGLRSPSRNALNTTATNWRSVGMSSRLLAVFEELLLHFSIGQVFNLTWQLHRETGSPEISRQEYLHRSSPAQGR
jgi:hypothetical protein